MEKLIKISSIILSIVVMNFSSTVAYASSTYIAAVTPAKKHQVVEKANQAKEKQNESATTFEVGVVESMPQEQSTDVSTISSELTASLTNTSISELFSQALWMAMAVALIGFGLWIVGTSPSELEME